jgi:hypothetical protein
MVGSYNRAHMESAMEHIEQLGAATIWIEGKNVFGPSGSDTELVTFLPDGAERIPVRRFDRLQALYDGQLSIEPGSTGRIVIGRKFLAYKREDVRKEAERLRGSLHRYLGLTAALM